MRAILILVPSLMALACATHPPDESAVIARAKGTCVCAIDGTVQEQIALGEWLEARALNGVVAWESNDCGEQTGDPRTTPDDFPICAQATFTNCAGARSSLAVVVATFRTGFTDRFGIMWAITGQNDVTRLELFGLANPPCAIAPNSRAAPDVARTFILVC